MNRLKKKPKNDYRHGDLRSALMEAAIHSIQNTGEVQFSLRDLANSAGVTHAAAYRHFSSKKAILLEIAKEGYSNLSNKFKKILENQADDIEGLGQAYVQFAVENPERFKIMFHPDIKLSEESTSPESLGFETFSHLLSAVELNIKNGNFIQQDDKLIAMTAWASVHGLSTLIVNDNLQKKMNIDSKKMAKIMTNNLMKGFLKRN